MGGVCLDGMARVYCGRRNMLFQIKRTPLAPNYEISFSFSYRSTTFPHFAPDNRFHNDNNKVLI